MKTFLFYLFVTVLILFGLYRKFFSKSFDFSSNKLEMKDFIGGWSLNNRNYEFLADSTYYYASELDRITKGKWVYNSNENTLLLQPLKISSGGYLEISVVRLKDVSIEGNHFYYFNDNYSNNGRNEELERSIAPLELEKHFELENKDKKEIISTNTSEAVNIPESIDVKAISKKIIGTWSITKFNATLIYIFKTDGSFECNQDSEVISGKWQIDDKGKLILHFPSESWFIELNGDIINNSIIEAKSSFGSNVRMIKRPVS